jgi:4-diphosphocytidyl-2-C-methyl-D-erythritol kinase
MVSFPPCKINLGLSVIEKRNDGFHNLETCFYPVPLTDVLEILPSTHITFTATGTVIPGPAADNLCLRAYQLLKKDFDLPPVDIHLHKVIPTGAGLGGGSSDAAHTLLLLNSMFELKLSANQLNKYAQQLGSDCAFFIHDQPMLGTGRGEILEPLSISLKGKFLVLLKPDIHVSTAEAYAGVLPAHPTDSVRYILEKTDIKEWKHSLRNDFENSVFQKHPAIASCKTELYQAGAVYASMSGSGAAVFGVFDNEVSLSHPFLIWSGMLR